MAARQAEAEVVAEVVVAKGNRFNRSSCRNVITINWKHFDPCLPLSLHGTKYFEVAEPPLHPRYLRVCSINPLVEPGLELV